MESQDRPSQNRQLEDATLVELAQNGDKVAFGHLIDRYWEVLAILVYSRVQNYADTEDILQESFLKAYRKLSTLRDRTKFAPWLYGIATTTTIDWLRREKRHTRLPLEEVDEASVIVQKEVHPENYLLEVIQRLPEKYQLVLILRYYKGMSYREIAKHLGEPEGTISNRLHRATNLLREWLERLKEKE